LVSSSEVSSAEAVLATGRTSLASARRSRAIGSAAIIAGVPTSAASPSVSKASSAAPIIPASSP
jgi:hypothetical protein